MSDIQAILAENEKLSREMLRANADSTDQSRRFPRENLQALGKAGVLGLMIPTQYGERAQGSPKYRRHSKNRHKIAHRRPWSR